MRHRRAPRPVSAAMDALLARVQPVSLLAEVQRAWPEAAGEGLAGQATPTAARQGEVTLTCVSSVWAAELELLGPELVARLNAVLGSELVVAIRTRGPSR